MSAITEVKIDLAEVFPHLPNAPIVEAALEIRTRAEGAWDETTIMQAMKTHLPEYPNVQSQTRMRQSFTIGATPSTNTRSLGWQGLVARSVDDRQIVQFNREGFVFGRLKPYEDWEALSNEAFRLWNIYVNLARPVELQRIGLRFINLINPPRQETRYEEYIQPAPALPRGLDVPFHGFMHHDILAVPGHPYAINVIRTIQPQATEHYAVILDIDVFTIQPLQFQENILRERLPEMRWLKNKVFFGSVTAKALESFK